MNEARIAALQAAVEFGGDDVLSKAQQFYDWLTQDSNVEPDPERPDPEPGIGNTGHFSETLALESGAEGVLVLKGGENHYFEAVEFQCLVVVETGAAAQFYDCLFSGPVKAPAHSALLRTMPGGRADVTRCTLRPKVPQATLDGVRGSNLHLFECEITACTDGVHVFGNLAVYDDPGAGDVVIQDSWIHDLATFPSDAHSDGWTHNDGVQIVGGCDITIRRTRFSGEMRSAGILAQATKHPISDLMIDGCWFENDSASGVNITGPGLVQELVVVNNTFPKAWDGARYPILLAAEVEQDGTFTIADNQWDDGSRPGPTFQTGHWTGKP